ncbi:uncharacterized protein [Polyergus mexicanus]|uniref:uncharacterized protein n=1 Tax=Polyergus mexicanus TaxID=615972 RepID=UPI0038B514AC
MEWSQEKVMELIDCYKQKSILWNPKDPYHFNRLKKNDAWEKIARDTGRSVEHCKKKMVYLLSALRREKLKMKRSMGMGKGADEVYKSTWFAFDSLKFLLDKNTPCLIFNTVNISKKIAPSQMPAPSVILRKRKATMEDKRLDKTFEILQTSSQAIQDDCQHFGNLVAAKLRKFSENVRTNLESDIIELFVKANRGFYNLPSTCNYFLREQMPATHQTNNSAPETSHLSSQYSPYATIF